MTGGLPEPVRGEVAVPGHFAGRTTQLAQQRQPVVRWQRAIWASSCPYVHPDDTVEVFVRDGADGGWKDLLDASSGQAVPGPPGLMLEWLGSREYRGLSVTATPGRYGTVVVEAVDARSGQVTWRHSPVPPDEFDSGPWSGWLRCQHPDTDLLIPHVRDRSRRLALLDPARDR